MKRDDKIKLDVISNIDEAFIDEVTQSRIHYSSKSAKSKSFFRSPRFAAVAASIVVLFSSLIIIFASIFSNGKQIPVYQGMTVSSEFPSEMNPTASLLSATVLSTETVSTVSKVHQDRIEDKVDDFLDISPEKDIYYANPGDDIYITVHIDNPDDFEILSFTLNGVKYSSYMFEAGSDMENLVLKVNVGETPGLASYTIDAIKYVDGEKIKDVKMEGDKTVNIGIYNPIQPTATVSNQSLTYSTFSFTSTVTDPKGVVAATNGKFYAILYADANVIQSYELSESEGVNVKFENLAPAKYTYAVVAVFDAYDGDGFGSHVLFSGSFSNVIQLDVGVTDILNYPKKSVCYEITAYNELITVVAAKLIRESDKEVLSIASPDKASFELDDDAFGMCYIELVCTYVGKNGTENCSFKSNVFAIPKQPVIGVMSRPYDSDYLHEILPNTFAVHTAVDFIPTTSDLNVYACADGMVKEIRTSQYNPYFSGYPGTTVTIVDANNIHYRYYLLESTSLKLYDTVKMGDVIGTIGSFDYGAEFADGPHLHFVMTQGDYNDSNFSYIIPPFVPSQELVINYELLHCNDLVRKKDAYDIWSHGETQTFNTQGHIFTDVTFEYSSTSEYVVIQGGKVTYNRDAMPTGSTEIEFTITAKLGNIVKTHVHTVTVYKRQ